MFVHFITTLHPLSENSSLSRYILSLSSSSHLIFIKDLYVFIVSVSPFSILYSTHCISSLPIKINFNKVINDYHVAKSNVFLKKFIMFFFILELRL